MRSDTLATTVAELDETEGSLADRCSSDDKMVAVVDSAVVDNVCFCKQVQEMQFLIEECSTPIVAGTGTILLLLLAFVL